MSLTSTLLNINLWAVLVAGIAHMATGLVWFAPGILYPLADIYVNDAFAAAHRAQCSLVGFTNVLPSCAGRLMEKELTTLTDIINNPKKPSVFLFGGAKFSDVIITIERLLENKTADTIILTGLPANAFLKAEGIKLGEKNEELLLKEGPPDLYGGFSFNDNKLHNIDDVSCIYNNLGNPIILSILLRLIINLAIYTVFL